MMIHSMTKKSKNQDIKFACWKDTAENLLISLLYEKACGSILSDGLGILNAVFSELNSIISG